MRNEAPHALDCMADCSTVPVREREREREEAPHCTAKPLLHSQLGEGREGRDGAGEIASIRGRHFIVEAVGHAPAIT